MPIKYRIWVFISGLVVITSLIIWPDLIEYYLTPRFLYLSGWLFLGLVFFYVDFKGSKSLRYLHLLDFAFFAFYLWQLLSCLWAHNPGEALITAQKTHTAFLSYFVVRFLLHLRPKETEKTLIWSNFGLSIFIIIYVTIEIFREASDSGISNEVLYAVKGASGNKSLLTEYLFLLLPFNFLGSHKLNKKTLFGTVIVYQMFLILILQTRTVYLALALCGLIFLIFRLRQQEGRQWFREKLIPIIGALIIGTGGVVFALGGFANFFSRLNPATWLDSDTARERLFVWQKTLGLIADNWLLGVGSGSWKIDFPNMGVGGSWRLDSQGVVFTRVHNDFLEVWAETGTPGFILFVSIFVLGLMAGWYAYQKHSGATKKSVLVVWLGLLGFIVISFFDFPKERIEHTMMWAVYLAYLAYFGRGFFQNKRIKSDPLKWWPIFAGSMAGILAFNFVLGFNRFNGEKHALGILNAKARENYEQMAEEARFARSPLYTIDPLLSPLSWYEGMDKYFRSSFKEALPDFEDAYRINPYNYNVVNNLALTLTQLERYEEAIPLYLEALRINKYFDECKFNLAYTYFLTGEYAKARKWASETSDVERKATFLRNIDNKIKETESQ